jgi:hypothetical protein
MMLPSVCVATLRGCTARPASRSRWRRPTTGIGEVGVPSPAGRTCDPALPTQRSGRKLGERCAARPPTCCRYQERPRPRIQLHRLRSDAHVGRVQHRDQGGVDRQPSDRRRPGRTCVPALQFNDQDVGSALPTSPKSLIASASDRDIGRGRHTQSKGGRPSDAAVGRTRHLALRFGG